jgi:hypothetical protein
LPESGWWLLPNSGFSNCIISSMVLTWQSYVRAFPFPPVSKFTPLFMVMSCAYIYSWILMYSVGYNSLLS